MPEKMKDNFVVRVHYTIGLENEDSFVLEAESLEEVQATAEVQLQKLCAKYSWSEIIEEPK
jgi:hypothetical protein